MGTELRRILLEAAQAVAVLGAILALGAVGTWLPPRAASAHYPDPPMSEAEQEGGLDGVRRWLVDGFNVLHVGVLRGRDRADWWGRERREELLARVERFRSGHEDAEVLVVFDGSHPPEPSYRGEVSVVFAPSADEWLVAAVREAESARAVAVVTADRRLADRVRRRGALVVPPRRFIERCERCV